MAICPRMLGAPHHVWPNAESFEAPNRTNKIRCQVFMRDRRPAFHHRHRPRHTPRVPGNIRRDRRKLSQFP